VAIIGDKESGSATNDTFLYMFGDLNILNTTEYSDRIIYLKIISLRHRNEPGGVRPFPHLHDMRFFGEFTNRSLMINNNV
jgi:hypothetical protein